MPTFGHTSASDPLGLAVDDDIVLVDVETGKDQQLVEVLSAVAAYITTATKAIKIKDAVTVNYELVGPSALVLNIGAAVATDWFIAGFTANSSFDKYPTVGVQCVKFTSPAKYVTFGPVAITVAGGFGLVNKWGATFAQGVSSRCSCSMQTAEALEETTGEYLDNGYKVYGVKQEIALEAYDAITPPAGGVAQSPGARTARDAFSTNKWTGFIYL